MNQEPILDEMALGRWEQLGGPRLIQEMIGLFLENMPEKIEGARTALSAGHLEALSRAAHGMVSSGGNVGARRLQALARELEVAALEDRPNSIPGLFENLETTFEQTRALLEEKKRKTGTLKKIAVVEDNPDNRLLLRAILETRYEMLEFETGQDALQGLETEMPDLVLLDISLPDLEGTELLKKLRAHEKLRSLPVIAWTAHAMTGDREKYLSMGFDGYVSKPIVDEAELVTAMERLLDRRAGNPSAHFS
ncbi:MAG: response regulator [Planctomycetes bacterium]|nr:response regulator [Planctomycetota bacterium]